MRGSLSVRLEREGRDSARGVTSLASLLNDGKNIAAPGGLGKRGRPHEREGTGEEDLSQQRLHHQDDTASLAVVLRDRFGGSISIAASR